MLTPSTIQLATTAFKSHGGIMRTHTAIQEGIHPRTLYAMRDSGYLATVSRGLYRLAEMPSRSDPNLAVVSLKIPNGVICLISALAYHKLTTQAPDKLELAVPRTTRTPSLDIPIKLYRFSGLAYSAGIEVHKFDGREVKVYSLEKTIADCFKFRSRIGLNIALEAMNACRGREGFKRQRVLDFARICRVEKLIRPFLHTGFNRQY